MVAPVSTSWDRYWGIKPHTTPLGAGTHLLARRILWLFQHRVLRSRKQVKPDNPPFIPADICLVDNCLEDLLPLRGVLCRIIERW